ncbi:unnamed protein product [Orchesella dallaii]|uniref:ABC transmembrane type-1 domain-containing protein n=1 Tax=Orchesella dallaii TaxID=48710 RepID=A0ABP1QJ98_9HEXA
MDNAVRRPSHDLHDQRIRSQHSRLRIIEPAGSLRDLRSIRSEQISHHTNPSWTRGQELSALGPYDPVEDADQMQKMFRERKQLHIYQLFRYADCFDWLLMIFGLALAVANSLIPPWLFYCAGITLQDMVVYERCKPHVNATTGLCTTTGYCDHTFEEVGSRFFRFVVHGWFTYICVQLMYKTCFTIAADRQTRRIRAAYFDSIVMKDMAWFDLNTDRDFAKAMTEEVTHIRLGTGDAIPSFLGLVCTIILMIVVVFAFNFRVALSFICFIPFCCFLVYLGNWAEQKRSMMADNGFVDARNVVGDNFSNIKMIKMYEMENAQCQRFSKSLDAMENTKTEIKWMTIAALTTGFLWFILNSATSLIFWFGHGDFHLHDDYCFGTETLERSSFFKASIFQGKITSPDHGPGVMLLITVDSVNLQNYSVRWLRQQISIITEEPVIFTGTISENILFGKLSANQYDIERACELAGIHDRIADLPNGYNTVISTNDVGDIFTRHEKRQLCLARVYLHKSRFILLDNPLQPEGDEMEPLLLSYIDQVRNTCTIIMASSTVNGLSKRADCVYYMENGSVVEYGTHIQLIQAKGKYFHRLEETINCSLESKKKFDSQLKAYKFSQVLVEKKRNSSNAMGVGGGSWVGLGSFSGGDRFGSVDQDGIFLLPNNENALTKSTSSKRGSSFLDNFVKLLGGEGKNSRGRAPSAIIKPGSIASVGSHSRASTNSGNDLETEDTPPQISLAVPEPSSTADDKRKSEQMLLIRNQQKLAMATASLEEAYNRHSIGSGGRRRSSRDEKYLPHGFGLMGFQRLNFARPLTNYATQIHKQRHRFLSSTPIFPLKNETTKGHSQNASKLFPNKANVDSSMEIRKDATKKPSRKLSIPQAHVRFSFIAETDKTWPNPPEGSSARLTHTNPNLRTSNEVNHYGRGSIVKPKTTKHVLGQPEDILAIAIAQSDDLERAGGSSSSGSGTAVEKRESATKPHRFSSSSFKHSVSSKIILDSDDIGMEQLEMDTYLAEYQAAVHVTAQSSVAGYWCDVFYVCKHDWLFIIPGILGSIVLGLSYVMQTVQIGYYFHTLESDPTVSSEAHLSEKVLKLSSNVVYIGIMTGAAAFVQEFCFGMAGKRMTRQLREKLFSHILTQDITWFDDPKHDIGILTFQIYAETTIVHHV